MFSEEFIYNSCKLFLMSSNYILLAGDPPRGLDPSLPFVEIKGENFGLKGSKNSYKPDLIAYKDNIFYIIECKPLFNEGDYNKLQETIFNKERIQELYRALNEKNILIQHNIRIDFNTFSESLTAYLCYSGRPNPEANLFKHIIITKLGQGYFY